MVPRRGALALLIAMVSAAPALTACGDDDSPVLPSPDFTVVQVDPDLPAPRQLAIQACAGLRNRAQGGTLYVQREAQDAQWLDELALMPQAVVDATAFLTTCRTEFPACVRYSYADQQRLLPNILTVAAVLGAVPWDVQDATPCETVAFDATVELADRDTPELATRYVFDRYIDQTTGLAMLNPGYDTQAEDNSDPPLVRDMSPALVDYVFSERLFVVFLVNGCRSTNPQRELLSDIVNAGTWPTPVGVYGYNNSWLVAGGYLYEAQTRCLASRNMGAIPTETGNLSFFSTRRPPIAHPSQLPRNPPEDVSYDPSQTYVAFVVGDGDNVRFIMTTRYEWLSQRLADCAQADPPCAPLTWTLSPHLPRLAPDVLEWYYAASRRTGRDTFILPPSGHLYSYPTSLNSDDQARFVSATEQDARLLGVKSVVHWDWMGTWRDAEESFLPRYARSGGPIRGIFPVNVPYLMPAFDGWTSDEFYRVLAGEDGTKLVVFRPFSWRGIDDRDEFFPSPQTLADRLGSYPPGTVTWVYMTSDGGLNLDNAFNALVPLLPDHVRLVSADTAAKLAIRAGSD